MKQLKLPFLFLFLFLYLMTISGYLGCSRDKCYKVLCHNGGVCKAGKCSCATGFKGEHCETVDSCANVTCYNGGVCVQGVCSCPTGYEGPDCGTMSRSKFVGNWTVFEKGSRTLPAQYPISIVTGSGITEVYLRNFYNYFRTPIKATISGSHGDTLTIPRQQYEGKAVEGKGYISSSATYGQYGTVTMRYEVIDSATSVVNDFGYITTDSDPSMWNK